MTTSTTSTPSTKTQVYTTSNPYELQFGYHRAVRRGPFIYVSGTTAVKFEHEIQNQLTNGQKDGNEDGYQESKIHHPTSAYHQALLAMERCIDAVERLGGKVGDVVRVRMFVANHEDCLSVGAAFKECFTPPTSPSKSTPFTEPPIPDPSTTAENLNTSTTTGQITSVEIGAAATMLVIQNGFVDPDMLVEIEVDAVVL